MRISRELHDRVAHDMAVVHQGLQLHEALRENDPERAAAKLGAAKATIRSALDATRDLSSELRRPAVEGGLEVALRELLGTYVPAEVSTDLSFDGDESYIPEPALPDHARSRPKRRETLGLSSPDGRDRGAARKSLRLRGRRRARRKR